MWVSALSVCRSSATDWTVTTSLTFPTDSVRSTRLIWPTVTGTRARMDSLNPVRTTLTSYGPAWMFVNEYAPCASVVVSRLRLVSVLRIVTLAPGTTAPCESTTLPTSPPYSSCASAGMAAAAKIASPRVNKPAPLVTAHLLGVFAGRSRLCAASPSRTKSSGPDEVGRSLRARHRAVKAVQGTCQASFGESYSWAFDIGQRRWSATPLVTRDHRQRPRRALKFFYWLGDNTSCSPDNRHDNIRVDLSAVCAQRPQQARGLPVRVRATAGCRRAGAGDAEHIPAADRSAPRAGRRAA